MQGEYGGHPGQLMLHRGYCSLIWILVCVLNLPSRLKRQRISSRLCTNVNVFQHERNVSLALDVSYCSAYLTAKMEMNG